MPTARIGGLIPRMLLAGIVAATSLLAGCGGPAAAAPTDAKALFIRAVDRAMALQSVHITGRIDLAGAVLGAVSGSTFDADIDFAQGALRAEGRPPSAGAAPLDIVIADGVWYRKNGSGWEKQGGGMIPMPPGDDIRSALSSFATDDRVSVTSSDVSCTGKACHDLVATAPPDVVWDRFAGVLRALVYVPQDQPADLAPVRVEIVADATTSDPVHIEITTKLGGLPAKVVIEGSGHDQPLTITAPTS